MMTFGFSTLIDVLSWAIVLTLGMKLAATLVLLSVNRDVWYRPGWGTVLWWVGKITPVIAAPCVIWLALLESLTQVVWLYSAVMLFVVIAVPLKIRQRRNRIAKQMAANLWSAREQTVV